MEYFRKHYHFFLIFILVPKPCPLTHITATLREIHKNSLRKNV